MSTLTEEIVALLNNQMQGLKGVKSGLPRLKIWKRKINDLRYKNSFLTL